METGKRIHLLSKSKTTYICGFLPFVFLLVDDIQAQCTGGEYFASNGECFNCPSGFYQDISGPGSLSHFDTSCEPWRRCQDGEYFASGSTKSSGTCVSCPNGYYTMQSGMHRETECLKQTECPCGKYLSGASIGNRGSCVDCPTGQYTPEGENGGNHSHEECFAEGDCGSGRVLVNNTGCSRGTCEWCTLGTYKETTFQAEYCTGHEPCGLGEFYLGNDPAYYPETTKFEEACGQCSSGKYSYDSGFGHYRTECLDRLTCFLGHYFVSTKCCGVTQHSTYWPGECRECQEYTYQDENDHQIGTCKSQRTCGPGTRFEPYESFRRLRTTPGLCLECDKDQYQDLAVHREEVCKSQTSTTCGAGERVTPNRTVQTRTCESCPSNTYQELTHHSSEECQSHSQCSPGEYLVGATATNSGICISCDSGNYQDAVFPHFETECLKQPVCSDGFILVQASTATKGVCTATTTTTSTPSTLTDPDLPAGVVLCIETLCTFELQACTSDGICHELWMKVKGGALLFEHSSQELDNLGFCLVEYNCLSQIDFTTSTTTTTSSTSSTSSSSTTSTSTSSSSTSSSSSLSSSTTTSSTSSITTSSTRTFTALVSGIVNCIQFYCADQYSACVGDSECSSYWNIAQTGNLFFEHQSSKLDTLGECLVGSNCLSQPNFSTTTTSSTTTSITSSSTSSSVTLPDLSDGVVACVGFFCRASLEACENDVECSSLWIKVKSGSLMFEHNSALLTVVGNCMLENDCLSKPDFVAPACQIRRGLRSSRTCQPKL